MRRAPLATFNGVRLDERQIDELIGIARGITADGSVNDQEIDYLRKWLAASEGLTANPVIANLGQRIESALADGIVDAEERAGLLAFLHRLTASDFELGEALKATTLPLCDPAPDLVFAGRRYCFTGTFTFGSRRDCEQAIAARGGNCGGLAGKTDVLVIGEYATDSWLHSTWGRKIEEAAQMRAGGHPIRIVSEAHWRRYL